MKKVVVLSVACVFIFLTAFSCLKFPEGELKLEFDPLAPKKQVTTPTRPPITKPQTPVVEPVNVLGIDGVNVDVHGSGLTLTAKDAAGNAIPVLTEGDVVSTSNVPDNSPTGKASGDFLAVVVKGDGSGYAIGLIKSTRDAANNDSNLGSWMDADGTTPVVAGITTGKSSGGTVDDGKIYIGDANKKVTIAGTDYVVDETKGQIDTVFFVGRWSNGPVVFEFYSSGTYLAQSFTGTWTWDGSEIRLNGRANIFFHDRPDDEGIRSAAGVGTILRNVRIDSALSQLKADMVYPDSLTTIIGYIRWGAAP